MSISVYPSFIDPRPNMARIAIASGGLTTSVTAYSVGDQVGTIFNLTNAVRDSGGFGEIRAMSLLDVNDIIGAYDVVLFNASVTLAADNAAFTLSDSDAASVVDIVSLPFALDIGANRFSSLSGLSVPYNCVGTTSLFAALICRTAHTFFTAATDLTLGITVVRH